MTERIDELAHPKPAGRIVLSQSERRDFKHLVSMPKRSSGLSVRWRSKNRRGEVGTSRRGPSSYWGKLSVFWLLPEVAVDLAESIRRWRPDCRHLVGEEPFQYASLPALKASPES